MDAEALSAFRLLWVVASGSTVACGSQVVVVVVVVVVTIHGRNAAG